MYYLHIDVGCQSSNFRVKAIDTNSRRRRPVYNAQENPERKAATASVAAPTEVFQGYAVGRASLDTLVIVSVPFTL